MRRTAGAEQIFALVDVGASCGDAASIFAFRLYLGDAFQLVTSDDIETFLHEVASGKTSAIARGKALGGRGSASRATALLGAIFSYAVKRHIVSVNPVHGVMLFAPNKREKRLSAEEYAMLGRALTNAEAMMIWPPAVSVARFIALTGWRKSEGCYAGCLSRVWFIGQRI
jgi:hypothetical protein